MDTVDRVSQRYYLSICRSKWVIFYAAWNQSEASKRKDGDQRDLLEDRLGGWDRGALVLSLNMFLTGDEAGRETKACLDKMEAFWQLSVANTTDMARWTDDTAIERAFHAAHKAMRNYQLAIMHRQYKAGVKKNKATAKAAANAAKAVKGNADLHVLLQQLQTMEDPYATTP
jgi:hypothetical protein